MNKKAAVMVKINNVKEFYSDGAPHRNEELYREMIQSDPYPHKDKDYIRRLAHSARGAQQSLKAIGLTRVCRSTWRLV